MQISDKNPIRMKPIEWYLPFFLMLSQYRLGILSLGEIGLIFFTMMSVVANHGKIRLPHSKVVSAVLYLFGYLIIRDLFGLAFNIGSYETEINRILEYGVLFLMSIYITNIEFDENRLFAAWKIAGSIFMIGLLYQVILVYVVGRSVAPISIIPGYALRSDAFSVRPSSFFTEPASFVCALLPLQFLAIKRVDYKWALLTTLMIILSTSTVGIVLSIVLWFYAVIRSDTKQATKIGFLFVAIVIVIIVFRVEYFASGLLKLSEVAGGGSTVNSRIICGLDTIRTFNLKQWIFGTNYSTPELYVAANYNAFSSISPVLVYYRAGHLFLNSFSMIIFRYGLIGLLFYSSIWIKCYKHHGFGAKWYIIMIFLSIFAQSKFLNSLFFMELMFMILYTNESSNNDVVLT